MRKKRVSVSDSEDDRMLAEIREILSKSMGEFLREQEQMPQNLIVEAQEEVAASQERMRAVTGWLFERRHGHGAC